ncbi:MAG: hypothetical protein MUC36_08710 [Planctomycetes bacterium]|nr:hypothetical protein [Planctomycetota bacterium]
MLRVAPAVSLLLGSAGSMAQSPLADLVCTFAPFDLDGDGRAEVRALEVVGEAGAPGQPLVVVLVEGQLWRRYAFELSWPPRSLTDHLRRFRDDIAADGKHVLMLVVDLHSGPPHQDGRTVLALRRLFQRLHALAPMQAAVLVGHFPDAMLVRTCNWRRNEVLTLPGKDGAPVAIDAATTNVRAVPEIVAHRCDLVLADLDGEWERCYVPGPATLVSAWASFGAAVPDRGGPCVALQLGEVPVTDVFHVRDGTAIADAAAFSLQLDGKDRDHEVSASDRQRGNPLARPEIAVSRIDVRGVAWRPGGRDFDTVPEPGVNITQGLRSIERPAVIAGRAGAAAVAPTWQPGPELQLRLLVDYFDRNHAFRTAPPTAAEHRPASLAHELGSGLAALRAADPAWADFLAPGYDVHQGADLLEVAGWLQRPAVLRTLRAHSDPWGAAFAASDPDALQRELGLPWHWVKDGDRLVPSWRDHRSGRADFVFWRAVWAQRNRNLPAAGGPFLLLHTGCEALSPPRSDLPYDDSEYGKFGHAESMLFFTECVAMLGRAKVFYDEPRDFAAVLGNGGTIGDAWRRYFELESQAANWDEVGGDIGRKRSYFWSIVGDCTLTLRRPAR